MLPASAILYLHPHPLISFLTMFETTIVWMKLISYVDVNSHYRQLTKERRAALKEEHKYAIMYPANVTFGNMLYFMAAPTLCYELEYPRCVCVGGEGLHNFLSSSSIQCWSVSTLLCRTEKIRKRFLVRRLLEIVFFGSVVLGLAQQWVLPTVENTFRVRLWDWRSLKDFAMQFVFDPGHTCSSVTPSGGPQCAVLVPAPAHTQAGHSQPHHVYESGRAFCNPLPNPRSPQAAVLPSAILPNPTAGLMMFYFYFHSLLNTVGELLHFGDRQFYRDW